MIIEIIVVVFAVVVVVLVAVVSESVIGMVVVLIVLLDVVLGVDDVKVDEDAGSRLDGAGDVPDEVVLCNVVTETAWFAVSIELKEDVAKFTLCIGEIVDGLIKTACAVGTVDIGIAVDCFVGIKSSASVVMKSC